MLSCPIFAETRGMKKHKLLFFPIFLLLTFFAFVPFAQAQEKIYQRAKLVDIRLEKEVQTFDYQLWGDKINSLGKSKGSGLNIPIEWGQEKAYIYIQLNGILYTGEYHPRASSRGRLGSEWVIGDPIDVRLNQRETNMYLLQVNGQELRVPLLRKERVKS